MSRTALAAPTKIYLTVQQGPSGATLMVSPTFFSNYNNISMTREEWNTFRLFMFHVLHRKNGYAGLEFGRKISPIDDTTMYILTFLYADIARLIAPSASDDPLKQLENTALALFSAKPADTLVNYDTSSLWLIAHNIEHKKNHLLSAAFNADLDGVKHIIEKTRTENRRALLSAPANADYPETNIHPDTAFKVALAAGDEEMAKEIAQYLDPTEIARQFKNVFGSDFSAFLKQQERDAETLFAGLKAAFNNATPMEVQNALNQASNTTSALQQKIVEFKNKLEDYVNKTRPLHNDFILAKAYEIYDKKLWSRGHEQLCLFLRSVIGLIQESTFKTSKKRWMDICTGIYDCALNIENHLPSYRRFPFVLGYTVDLSSRGYINQHGMFVGSYSVSTIMHNDEIILSVYMFAKIVSHKNVSFGKLAS